MTHPTDYDYWAAQYDAATAMWEAMDLDARRAWLDRYSDSDITFGTSVRFLNMHSDEEIQALLFYGCSTPKSPLHDLITWGDYD